MNRNFSLQRAIVVISGIWFVVTVAQLVSMTWATIALSACVFLVQLVEYAILYYVELTAERQAP